MITRDSEISEHGLQVIPVTNGDVSQEKSSGMANSQENGNGTTLCDIEGISQNNVEVKKVKENDKDTESESKESENSIPVDRGWAWVIMISKSVCHLLICPLLPPIRILLNLNLASNSNRLGTRYILTTFVKYQKKKKKIGFH